MTLGIIAATLVALAAIYARHAVLMASAPAAVERERQQGLAAQLRSVSALHSTQAQRDAFQAIARFHGLDEDALQVTRELSR